MVSAWLRAVGAIMFIAVVTAASIVFFTAGNTISTAVVVSLSALLTALQLWRLYALFRLLRPGRRAPADSLPTDVADDRPTTTRRTYIIPFELPPVPELVGRDDEIAMIRTRFEAPPGPGPRIIALYGDPGVGKTALAIRSAYAAADLFPDGVLFADLWGHTHSAKATHVVLRGFVDALLAAGEQRPSELSALRKMYRKLTDIDERGARVLVVLDGVESEALVDELMPTSPTCAVLMTSRRRPDLAAADVIELRPLASDDAMKLFKQLVTVPTAGQRETEEILRRAAEEMVRRAAGYPLALQLTAAALANGKNWPAGVIAETMLSQPADPSKDPRHQALDLSFALLADDEQRALRALGLLEQPVFQPWMLVALLDGPDAARIDEQTAWRLCDRLVNARLLEHATDDPTGIAEFRVLDHVHDYAEALWPAADLRAHRAAAHRRLDDAREARSLQPLLDRLNTDVYATLERGKLTHALSRARDTLALARERVHGGPDRPDDEAEAGERLVLAALAEVLAEVGSIDDAREMSQLALVGHHPAASARALRCQGRLLWRQRRLDEAVQALSRARSVADELRDHGEEIRIVRELAVARALRGDIGDAIRLLDDVPETGIVHSGLEASIAWARSVVLVEAYDGDNHRIRALDLAQDAADRASTAAKAEDQRLWQAWAGLQQARVARRRPQLPQAREHARAALDLFIAMRHRYGAASCRREIGRIYLEENRFRDALPVLEEARETLATLDDRWVAASVALDLARARRLHGHLVEAERELTTAHRIYESLDITWSGAEPARAAKALEHERDFQVEARRRLIPTADPLPAAVLPRVTAGSAS